MVPTSQFSTGTVMPSGIQISSPAMKWVISHWLRYAGAGCRRVGFACALAEPALPALPALPAPFALSVLPALPALPALPRSWPAPCRRSTALAVILEVGRVPARALQLKLAAGPVSERALAAFDSRCGFQRALAGNRPGSRKRRSGIRKSAGGLLKATDDYSGAITPRSGGSWAES
jgi:hypothetical protein